jgi:hypothetical protein
MTSPGCSVAPMALGSRLTAVPGHTDSAAVLWHMDLVLGHTDSAAVLGHTDSAAVLGHTDSAAAVDRHMDSAAVGRHMDSAAVGRQRGAEHSICLRACHFVFLGSHSVPVHEHIEPPDRREGAQAMDSICLRSCLA